jgi:hypothetical protein
MGNRRPDKLKVMAILKLSYDHLPAYLKRCFEYCSLFPKSHVFSKEDLVKLWIAQGFIQSRGRDTMEEAGIAYFSELLIRSFFQSSSIDNKEIFSMHDLIHDLAQSISSPNCCQVKDNESGKFLNNLVTCPCSVKMSSSPCWRLSIMLRSCAHFYCLSATWKIFGQALDKVFRTLKYIRGLDLSSSPDQGIA